MSEKSLLTTRQVLELACVANRINGGRFYVKDVDEPSDIVYSSGRTKNVMDDIEKVIVDDLSQHKKHAVRYHPHDRFIKYWNSRRNFPYKQNDDYVSIWKCRIRHKSNKNLMLDMMRNKIPYEITDEDREMLQVIDDVLQNWKFDIIANRLSTFNQKLFNMAKRKRIFAHEFKTLMRLPHIARRDMDRRNHESILIDECVNFTGSVGDWIESPFRPLSIKKSSHSYKKYGIVSGVVDNDGEKYPVWFRLSNHPARRIEIGREYGLTGKVSQITNHENVGISEAMLKKVTIDFGEENARDNH